jgi:hypothetical protein
MPMGVWQRIGTLSLGTHSCFLVVPFLGVLNGRRLFLSPPRRASTLPSLTPRRKDSGFIPSFLSSSPASLTPPHCFRIINPPLHLLKITSTMRVPSTSTSTFILFAMSSKTVLFASSTALPTTWLPTHLRRLFRLLKSSILRRNSDFPHLEGECWNYKVTMSSTHRFPVSPFSVTSVKSP